MVPAAARTCADERGAGARRSARILARTVVEAERSPARVLEAGCRPHRLAGGAGYGREEAPEATDRLARSATRGDAIDDAAVADPAVGGAWTREASPVQRALSAALTKDGAVRASPVGESRTVGWFRQRTVHVSCGVSWAARPVRPELSVGQFESAVASIERACDIETARSRSAGRRDGRRDGHGNSKSPHDAPPRRAKGMRPSATSASWRARKRRQSFITRDPGAPEGRIA
jgi:hypothetical protein